MAERKRDIASPSSAQGAGRIAGQRSSSRSPNITTAVAGSSRTNEVPNSCLDTTIPTPKKNLTNRSNDGRGQNLITEMMEEEKKRLNYGSTNEMTPLKPKSIYLDCSGGNARANDKSSPSSVSHDGIVIGINSPLTSQRPMSFPQSLSRLKLHDDMFSRDTEFVSTPASNLHYSDKFDFKSCWWRHPKVKENWRVFFAAFGLLLVGIGLIVMGIVVTAVPDIGFQSYVFFIAGTICFIPGAYHVVFMYCAVHGKRGYDFYQLPLFN